MRPPVSLRLFFRDRLRQRDLAGVDGQVFDLHAIRDEVAKLQGAPAGGLLFVFLKVSENILLRNLGLGLDQRAGFDFDDVGVQFFILIADGLLDLQFAGHDAAPGHAPELLHNDEVRDGKLDVISGHFVVQGELIEVDIESRELGRELNPSLLQARPQAPFLGFAQQQEVVSLVERLHTALKSPRGIPRIPQPAEDAGLTIDDGQFAVGDGFAEGMEEHIAGRIGLHQRGQGGAAHERDHQKNSEDGQKLFVVLAKEFDHGVLIRWCIKVYES